MAARVNTEVLRCETATQKYNASQELEWFAHCKHDSVVLEIQLSCSFPVTFAQPGIGTAQAYIAGI
jgi:hypothetical protein